MAGCKISIVIPVYNVEKYLRKCLESVVHQTFTEYEVIIVNDGSKDNSLEILKEYKAAFPDLITVYDIENKGVSHARNYGVNRAGGKYVLFVDSDDFIEPEMCEKLYHKAEEDKSDIVICDRYDFFENEDTKKIKRTKSSGFYMPFGRTIDLNQMKYELVHISPFPWDKLYRIELVKQFPFPVGSRFEDLAIMYQICLTGGRISVIDDYLYNYRRTATSGFLNTFSKETKDIVKACAKIVEDFKENDWFDHFYDELEYICARHLLLRYNVLFDQEQKGKLKLKIELIRETQDFLDTNFSNWRENRYLKYTIGKEMKQKFERYKKKDRLLRQAVYHEYIPGALLQKVIKIKQRSKKTLFHIKDFLKSRNKLSFMKIFRQTASEKYTHYYETLPVNETLTFYESKHGEDVAGNIFRLIHAMSEEKYRKFTIQLVLKKAYKEYFTNLLKRYHIDYVNVIAMGSEEYLKALATAKYLITDTSFPTYYIKRLEQIYLNTWHGTPLKAMGRIVPFREYALGNVQRNFLIADYLLYQNEFSKEVFIRDYMLEKIYQGKVMISGYPRNSAFFDEERRGTVRKLCIEKLYKEESKERAENSTRKELQFIAYMPTWRGLLDKKESKKQIRIITKYFEEIDLSLKDDQVFFVKLHPFVKGEIDYTAYQHIKPFPEEFETYDFLNATDVLITDYSSIMFDYAASGRKIVLFTYDREEYLKDRGMYLSLDNIKFTKADTVEELIKAILLPSEDQKFCEEFCAYDNKNTAKLVAKQLFFPEEMGSEKDNMNIENCILSEKKKVLIFLGGLGKGEKTKQLIEEINALDTNKLDYYLCFNADSVKSATFMIAKMKKEIGYFPIVYSINALKSDKMAMALFLRYGLKAFGIQKRIEKIARRERKKYFGDISFDFVLNYSVKDKMLHQICGSFEKEKYINLQDIDLRRYQTDKHYRKSVKYLIKNSKGFHYGTIPKELLDAGIGIKKGNATKRDVISSEKISLPQYIDVMTRKF